MEMDERKWMRLDESESFVKFINLIDSVVGFLSVLDTALRAKVLVRFNKFRFSSLLLQSKNFKPTSCDKLHVSELGSSLNKFN